MNFTSEKEFNEFKKILTFLAAGSQGECFLDDKKKIVYKLFFDCFDEDYSCYYDKDEILRFNHLKNKTFIWPTNLITCNSKIIGYTAPYIKAQNLYKTNPLTINLDNLELAIKKAYVDLKLLEKNNIVIFDIMYNLLFSKTNLYAIDNTEYCKGEETIENYRAFGKSISYFLVDGYFNDFIKQDKILNEMFYSLDINILEFLKEFRMKLSANIGSEITKLQEAKKLIKKTYPEHYIREIKK